MFQDCLPGQDPVLSDAVFAHDFDNICGHTITSLVGPDATATLNISTSSTDPFDQISIQHVTAPNGTNHAFIDTNTQLGKSVTELTFVISYNDRGDNGSEFDAFNVTRLLSTYRGGGSIMIGEVALSLVSFPDRLLSFTAGGESVPSTESLPFQDGVWHQAAVVFDNGQVSFYFDGIQSGDAVVMASVTSIAAQTNEWTLLEDPIPANVGEEYFDGGDYDNTALWYRALSLGEIETVFEQGFVTEILLGDVNLDQQVNLLDVAPFVQLLATGACQREADTNQDGTVNLLDVQAFVDLLSGG